MCIRDSLLPRIETESAIVTNSDAFGCPRGHPERRPTSAQLRGEVDHAWRVGPPVELGMPQEGVQLLGGPLSIHLSIILDSGVDRTGTIGSPVCRTMTGRMEPSLGVGSTIRTCLLYTSPS